MNAAEHKEAATILRSLADSGRILDMAIPGRPSLSDHLDRLAAYHAQEAEAKALAAVDATPAAPAGLLDCEGFGRAGPYAPPCAPAFSVTS